MKIAVDANQLNAGYTGVGRYLYNLLKHMAPLAPDMEFTLFFSSEIEINISFENIKKIVLKTDHGNLFWQNTLLRKAVQKGNFDLLWSPNYYSPLFLTGKSVISMHDVSWKALPDNYSFINRTIRNVLSKYSLKKASTVFTLSEFSRKEIMKYYGTDPALIEVIHLGIDDSFRRSDSKSADKFRKQYGISEGPVIGFLGSIFKRRNVDKLIHSYQSLKQNHPAIKLILIGEIYDTDVQVQLKYDPSIVWIKRLSEKEINAFYSSIDLFVYISEYEGFGLPPLEALSCGTIPLLLRKSSLNEVFSEIALFVEHADPEEIREKIDTFLKNRENINKQILLKFREMENYFNWKRVAGEYIRIMKKLVHSDPENNEE